jgi:hypothetical protein
MWEFRRLDGNEQSRSSPGYAASATCMAPKGPFASTKPPKSAMRYPPELLAEFGSWAVAGCSRTGPHREHLAILSMVTSVADVTGLLPLCGLRLYVLIMARKFKPFLRFFTISCLGLYSWID